MDANEKKEVIKKRFQEIAMSGGDMLFRGGRVLWRFKFVRYFQSYRLF